MAQITFEKSISGKYLQSLSNQYFVYDKELNQIGLIYETDYRGFYNIEIREYSGKTFIENNLIKKRFTLVKKFEIKGIKEAKRIATELINQN